MTASLDATFGDMLTALMDKYEYGIEDVAQRANTGTFVVREWLCGRAVPAAHIRRDVLNSLDDPTVVDLYGTPSLLLHGDLLCTDDAAYQQMAAQIAASFARNDVGASQGNSTAAVTPIDAGPGIYGNSQFYIANGSYGALNTCNRWTASALQAAGINTAPRMSLTASSVLGAARHSARRCTTSR